MNKFRLNSVVIIVISNSFKNEQFQQSITVTEQLFQNDKLNDPAGVRVVKKSDFLQNNELDQTILVVFVNNQKQKQQVVTVLAFQTAALNCGLHGSRVLELHVLSSGGFVNGQLFFLRRR